MKVFQYEYINAFDTDLDDPNKLVNLSSGIPIIQLQMMLSMYSKMVPVDLKLLWLNG